MGLRDLTPWYLKIAAKVVLARLPVSYRTWQALRVFSHGNMDQAAYAYQVFRQHYDACEFPRKQGGFVALEIGPGDGLLSAVIAASFGASRCFLVDNGYYAVSKLAPYREIADLLRGLNLHPPDLSDARDLSTILQRCNAVYLTRGLASLREVPTRSVDFTWSHAVLEHVRRHEFDATMSELHRVMAPNGRSSHQVDLQDHLGGGLSNMRFPSRWWEADWIARSGFYTNRLRYAEMMRVFASERFAVETVRTCQFTSPPLRRRALAAEFQDLADEDLMISGFHAVLREA
jgi:SAM-dependent methyltransferase